MQIDILSGIFSTPAPDLRTSMPRNMVPVVKKTGASMGYLKPADGIERFATGPGVGRGGIRWNSILYRVIGGLLCRVEAGGNMTSLGSVGMDGKVVTLDYGFDRLSVVSAGGLYLYSAADGIVPVTAAGVVIDAKWMAGYYVFTDGTSIGVTELTDSTAVNPLKYGSSESDPDPIKALDELRNELYAFNRYTIEVFENVGGDLFPFQTVQGALVPKGIIGTHAYSSIGDTFVFVGSGRGEAPGVYLMMPGDTKKLSTREVDVILSSFTEGELSYTVVESLVRDNQQQVLIHLPDRTLVYDTIASALSGESVWYTLDSGMLTPARYRARNFVWCYERWCCEDPTSSFLGQLTDQSSEHYGSRIGWEFGTPMLYNEGNDGIVLEMELMTLPGRVPLGKDPSVWMSYSTDGESWGVERGTKAGEQGQRFKRIAWRNCGRIRNWRVQKFRGTSDAHLPVIRLEAKAEPLFTRPGSGA